MPHTEIYPRDLQELEEMRIAAEATDNVEFAAILCAFEQSWRVQTPGENVLFATALTQSGLRAVIRSLVPRDVEQASAAAWKEMTMCQKSGECGPRFVSPDIPLIDYEEACTATCSVCGNRHLALETRCPVRRDGPYLKRRIVLCAHDRIFTVAPLRQQERYARYEDMVKADLKTHDNACTGDHFEERFRECQSRR